jgi:putative endonuclease
MSPLYERKSGMDRRAIGTAAEATARDYLLGRGLKLVCENFRCRTGELDLIALDGKALAIVEVRLRTRAEFGGAAASIDWRKRARIIRTTQYLLLKRPELRCYPVRFDVITLDSTATAAANIQWIRGAFEMRS